jgi:acetyl-CoA acetyltransferase
VSSERDVVIVAGVRTPFIKAGTLLADTTAVELGRTVVREAIERADVDPRELDEVIVGNIAGPSDAANVARTSGRGIFLMRSFMDSVTFKRNGDDGMQVRLSKSVMES